jgi:hypothetical protein
MDIFQLTMGFIVTDESQREAIEARIKEVLEPLGETLREEFEAIPGVQPAFAKMTGGRLGLAEAGAVGVMVGEDGEVVIDGADEADLPEPIRQLIASVAGSKDMEEAKARMEQFVRDNEDIIAELEESGEQFSAQCRSFDDLMNSLQASIHPGDNTTRH